MAHGSRRWFLKQLGGLGAALASSSALASSLLCPAPLRAAGRPKRLLLVILDGINADVLGEGMAAGRYPQLAALAAEGHSIDNALTVFPSVTTTAHSSILTGVMPDRHGIVGINWFDRSRRDARNYCRLSYDPLQLNGDLADDTPTLFEHFPEGSLAIQEMVNRGSGANRTPLVGAAIATLRNMFEDGRNTKVWHALDRQVADWTVETLASPSPPPLVVSWFAASDKVSHAYGPSSPEVDRCLVALDGHFGRIRRALCQNGLAEETVMAIVGDHGQLEVSKHLDLAERMDGLGFDVKNRPIIEGIFPFNEYDCVLATAGNSMSHVYLNAEGVKTKRLGLGVQRHDWSPRPDLERLRAYPIRGERLDLLETLRRWEGLDLVLCRDGDDGARVLSAEGSGRVSWDLDGLAWEVLEGKDPLGYGDEAGARDLVGAGPCSEAAWLQATAGSERPDAVAQIARTLRHDRSGDLVLTTRPGWDFLSPGPDLRGAHGGFTRGDMRVPMLFWGAGVARGHSHAARVVDLAPTLLHLLGRLDATKSFDGRVLPGVKDEGTGERKRRFDTLYG